MRGECMRLGCKELSPCRNASGKHSTPTATPNTPEREIEGVGGFLSSFKGPTRQESPTLWAQSRCTTHQLPQSRMVPEGRAANTLSQ